MIALIQIAIPFTLTDRLPDPRRKLAGVNDRFILHMAGVGVKPNDTGGQEDEGNVRGLARQSMAVHSIHFRS